MFQQFGIVEELIDDSLNDIWIPLSKIADGLAKFLNPAREGTIEQEIDRFNRESRMW